MTLCFACMNEVLHGKPRTNHVCKEKGGANYVEPVYLKWGEPRSDTAWGRFIGKYAKGQAVCNCGNAYYHRKDGDPQTEYRNCRYGCQANQYAVKEYIAKCIEDDNK